LGKGYATIPSITNNQLPAQVNYDHHFCKIQSINKEQRHIDDQLANSLVNCLFLIIHQFFFVLNFSRFFVMNMKILKPFPIHHKFYLLLFYGMI
jgi:hypothetical protein